jgi:hypothetical protein
MRSRGLLALAFGAVVVAVAVAVADHHEGAMGHHVALAPEDLKWTPGPPSLPPGIEAAVLEGDPSKEGPFTLRFKAPANYTVPPHWHPAVEHVTVLQGSFSIALGEKIDKSKGKTLKAGGFAAMPPKVAHFAWIGPEGAVIQLHGIGPWGINYINPADDPRTKAAVK